MQDEHIALKEQIEQKAGSHKRGLYDSLCILISKKTKNEIWRRDTSPGKTELSFHSSPSLGDGMPWNIKTNKTALGICNKCLKRKAHNKGALQNIWSAGKAMGFHRCVIFRQTIKFPVMKVRKRTFI